MALPLGDLPNRVCERRGGEAEQQNTMPQYVSGLLVQQIFMRMHALRGQHYGSHNACDRDRVSPYQHTYLYVLACTYCSHFKGITDVPLLSLPPPLPSPSSPSPTSPPHFSISFALAPGASVMSGSATSMTGPTPVPNSILNFTCIGTGMRT